MEPSSNVTTIRFLFWIEEILYNFATVGYKVTVLLLYRRAFACHQTFLYILYGVGAFVVAQGVAMTIGLMLACTPIQASWTLEGYCINGEASGIALNALNITTATTIAVMPIPLVWRLNLPKGQKISLGMIFLLGFLYGSPLPFLTVSYVVLSELTSSSDVAATVTRLPASVFTFTNPDFTYSILPIATWSTIEITVGITCACLPLLRPVLLLVIPQSIQKLCSGSGQDRKPRSGHRAWPFRPSHEPVVTPLRIDSMNDPAHNNRLALELVIPGQPDEPLPTFVTPRDR